MDIRGFCSGLRYAMPIMLGYFPVGFAYGVLAVKAGLSPFWAGMMSFFVYAGSAQFIAVGMLVAGASVPAIVLVTFVVNLRHLLMSAALIPYLREWSRLRQAWFGFEMTDETFAVNLSRFSSVGVRPREVIAMNFFSHIGWTVGGVGGALFGDVLTDIKPLGLDYALVGMFVALILPHLRVRRRRLAVIAGGSLSVVLALSGAGQWNVLIAAACAASLAAFAPMKDEEEAARG